MRQVLAMYNLTRKKSNEHIFIVFYEEEFHEGKRNKSLLCTKWRGGSVIFVHRRKTEPFCKCQSLLSQQLPDMLMFLLRNNQRQTPTRTRYNLRFLLFASWQLLALNWTYFYGQWTHFNVFKGIFCPYDEDFDIVLTLK